MRDITNLTEMDLLKVPTKILLSIARGMVATFKAIFPAKRLARNLLRLTNNRNRTIAAQTSAFHTALTGWNGMWSFPRENTQIRHTDASLKGWGATLLDTKSQMMKQAAAQWHKKVPQQMINLIETSDSPSTD